MSNVKVRGPLGNYKPSGLIVDDTTGAVEVNAAVFICTDNSFVNYYEFRTSKVDTSQISNGEDLPYNVLY